ncbi:MAG: anthranilate synthase component II [Flavobacteriales bacterium]
MKILVFDNYDSFTYNLVHYVKQLGYKDVDVFRNDKIALADINKYDKILLSPGPGIPSEAGILLEVIKEYGPKKSILGVCLGHQAIGEVYGCQLENMDKVLHGIATPMTITKNDVIYKGLPETFSVGRYHSWQIKEDTLTPEIEVTGVDDKGSIMSIRHKKYNVVGVQYHPESVLTEHGLEIMKNWLEN